MAAAEDVTPAPDTAPAVASDTAPAAEEDTSTAAPPADTASAAGPSATLPDARPALEPGFTAYRIATGADVVTLAVVEPLPPLYRGVSVRLAADRDGKPLRLADASVQVALAKTGDAVGRIEARGREDGRVALDLPPLPVSSRYRLTVDAHLGDGSAARWTLDYDASTGIPSPPR
ncbi:MAG: hypothetical protein EP329_22705 [Deltaproteobacteria bacterium]|nr:MAG: hypothetical protein EP329_22705 [Deltaproteobacteria bacterium]